MSQYLKIRERSGLSWWLIGTGRDDEAGLSVSGGLIPRSHHVLGVARRGYASPIGTAHRRIVTGVDSY